MGHNGNWYGFIAVIMIVDVIGNPHGVPMLAIFVGLQRSEARLIKIQKLYVIVHYYGVR